jgi:hypothetical protein
MHDIFVIRRLFVGEWPVITTRNQGFSGSIAVRILSNMHIVELKSYINFKRKISQGENLPHKLNRDMSAEFI